MIPIQPSELLHKYEGFWGTNYADAFRDFWPWKSSIESKLSISILDPEYIDITNDKLTNMATKWILYRGKKSSEISENLMKALETITDDYYRIKRLSLTDLDAKNREPLRNVWHQLGMVKPGSDSEPQCNRFLVMPVTKFLMFLWGQTPALDSYVRKELRTSGLLTKNGDYWNFDNWFDTILKLKRELHDNQELLKEIERVSHEHYSNSALIPCGQIIDAYLWKSHKDVM